MRKVCIVFLLTLLPILACAEDSPSILHVSGKGDAMMVADRAAVTLGIEVSQEHAEEAQAELAQLQADVLEALRSSGAAKVESTHLSLYPRYAKKVSPPIIIAYTASISIQFECPAADAGAQARRYRESWWGGAAVGERWADRAEATSALLTELAATDWAEATAS